MGLVPTDDSAEDAPRVWSGLFLPWLLSATTHLLVLLLLALSWGRESGAVSHSMTTLGSTLQAHLVSGGSIDQADQADGTEVAGPRYFDDEPSEPNHPSPMAQVPPMPSPLAIKRGGGGRLAEALNAAPPVSFPGILPSTVAITGFGGASEGGGVGDARGMSQQSQPASSGGAKLRGGYARTGVFGVVGEGQKFIYVFDRSGSMDGHGGLPLAMAKAELVSSLKDLGQTHQFQIIFYNEHPRIFSLAGSPGRLVFGNDYNKLQAQKFVGSITADGATQHEEALVAALRMAPHVIFFLTDADEPRMTAQQMARIARLNPGTSINAIEFGYGPQSDPNNFLVQLARQNAGQHVYVDVSRLGRAR